MKHTSPTVIALFTVYRNCFWGTIFCADGDTGEALGGCVYSSQLSFRVTNAVILQWFASLPLISFWAAKEKHPIGLISLGKLSQTSISRCNRENVRGGMCPCKCYKMAVLYVKIPSPPLFWCSCKQWHFDSVDSHRSFVWWPCLPCFLDGIIHVDPLNIVDLAVFIDADSSSSTLDTINRLT
jgi:hypothetical protein